LRRASDRALSRSVGQRKKELYMGKPANWYAMDYEQRRDWEKAERQRQDLEYEADECRRTAEDAARRLRREQESTRERLSSMRSQMDADNEERANLEHELSLAHQWLRENGHWDTFDTWASTRRYD